MAAAPLILIVDDFGDALDLYREYLTFKGYRVAVAENGRQAVDTARDQRPALIFMDLQMPEMSGGQALRLLRNDDVFQAVPVVAFTAHALDDERRNALREGFDEVIAKPCLPDDLIAAVDRLLRDGRPASAAGFESPAAGA